MDSGERDRQVVLISRTGWAQRQSVDEPEQSHDADLRWVDQVAGSSGKRLARDESVACEPLSDLTASRQGAGAAASHPLQHGSLVGQVHQRSGGVHPTAQRAGRADRAAPSGQHQARSEASQRLLVHPQNLAIPPTA